MSKPVPSSHLLKMKTCLLSGIEIKWAVFVRPNEYKHSQVSLAKQERWITNCMIRNTLRLPLDLVNINIIVELHIYEQL